MKIKENQKLVNQYSDVIEIDHEDPVKPFKLTFKHHITNELIIQRFATLDDALFRMDQRHLAMGGVPGSEWTKVKK